ncbi:serine protease 27-like isoform X2 [Sardina pilchardus]|uniref:serine protease 27-like isoform X2 n=1 Tax=Sardina pilchardus TaxID=27697 RepID=UPI002E12FBA5
MSVWGAVCVAVVLLLRAQAMSAQSDDKISNACGQAPLNTRMDGGQNAPAEAWPWQASLHSNSERCGGTLITKDWVISAAHCFSSTSTSSWVVYLGRQSQEGSNPNEVSRTISRIILHPHFNTSTFENDIALLRLSTSVTFTDYIRPVCLAAAGSTFDSGAKTWITGLGTITASGEPQPSPEILQETQFQVVANSDCQEVYSNDIIYSSMICAQLLRQEGENICKQCGNPLVIKQGSVWVQVGILFLDGTCFERQLPGVFTRVSQYQSWIKSHITSNQPGFVTSEGSGVKGASSLLLGLLALSLLISC